jgi:hypothetical protein
LVALVFELLWVVVVFITVSFLRLSGMVDVSFFIVSVVILLTESVLRESVLALPLPLQAANDVVMINAKKLTLTMFFIVFNYF